MFTWLCTYVLLNVLCPLDQGDMLSVNYTATYSDDGRLMEIDVEWEDEVHKLACIRRETVF